MLLTVLAGVLRFTDLGLQSLWVDEALTTWVLDPAPARPSTCDGSGRVRRRAASREPPGRHRGSGTGLVATSADEDQLAPGRAVGPFRVVDRHSYHAITTALLRAPQPQEIRLGVIHRADTLGAPQVNVFLNPGRNAG